MSSATFKTMSSSKSWEWPTPKSFYDQLDAEFHFNFDPCPLGGGIDGSARLLNNWENKRVFINPPYGPEIRKFLDCWKDAEIAVYLLPARVDTKWFHEICLPFAKEIRFIKGRLRFGDGKYPAPFPSMVVVFERGEVPDGE
jgi:hypothetical protein